MKGSARILRPLVYVGALAALLVGQEAGGQCEYEVTVIEGPWCNEIFGFPPTAAIGINDLGHVTGYYNACTIGPATPFVWTSQSGLITLELPNVSRAWAWDIDHTDAVVGTMDVPGSGFRGFLYDDGRTTELPPAGGGGWCQTSAIENGLVVGYRSLRDDVVPHNAFIWSSKGGFIDLGVMNGPNSSATDINKRGTVVGWTGSSFSTDNTRGFLWQEGEVTELAMPGALNTVPFAVNNRQQIVGRAKVPTEFIPGSSTTNHAFLWDAGTFYDLGTLDGFNLSIAHGVNDARQIVGLCRLVGGAEPDHAFLWQNGAMYDLNELVSPDDPELVIKSASAISENGQIAASGVTFGHVVGVLLTPIVRVGDFDYDCKVSTKDLLHLLAMWGPCKPSTECTADLDQNGIVDQDDLAILLENWG